MSKIILQKNSPGDAITDSDLNSDLNQFAGTNFKISQKNIREQGLDYLNFKQGVLSHPTELVFGGGTDTDGDWFADTPSYIFATAQAGSIVGKMDTYMIGVFYQNFTQSLGCMSVGQQNLGEMIKTGENDYIYRLSFQGYFVWDKDLITSNSSSRLTSTANLDGGLLAFLKVNCRIKINGQLYTDDVTHLERSICGFRGGSHIEELGYAGFMCTISDKIDATWFKSHFNLSPDSSLDIEEIEIEPRIEWDLLQNREFKKVVGLFIQEKPLQYIQKFRK